MAIRVRGEPGLGKTSLLNRIKHEIEADTSQLPRCFRCISIPTGSLNTCHDFAAEIWEGLVKCVDAENVRLAQAPFRMESFGAFSSRLESVQAIAPDMTFVACLDDFDRILDQCNELEQKRISGLISHLIDGTPFPIVFFFTLARDLPGQYLSPFTMNALSLHQFDEAETTALVAGLLRNYVTPTAAEFTWIFDYTGGHPYFTRLLVAKLFDLAPGLSAETGIGQNRLEQAANAAVASDRAYLLLKGVYSSLFDDGQRHILLQLACSDRRLIAQDEIARRLRSSVIQLARKEYLTEVEDGVFKLRSKFVVDWLRHWDEFTAEVDRLNIRSEQPLASKLSERAPVQSSPSVGITIDRATQRVYVEGHDRAQGLPPGRPPHWRRC